MKPGDLVRYIGRSGHTGKLRRIMGSGPPTGPLGVVMEVRLVDRQMRGVAVRKMLKVAIQSPRWAPSRWHKADYFSIIARSESSEA